ncbi:MAG: helix-turn-helix domain-containing protein [Lachnospiraceae bacterium]|nr:helix-turn-helix domain-containing protein [Lachnospiraceae bacterium]
MILADKIINERKKNGWSQEDLAELLDVSRQSVSKWEGAQSVPDLSKILKMAEIFHVSTDYLLKDELEPDGGDASYYEKTDETSAKRRVSLEEAQEYLSLRKQILPVVGIGVFLCITCPVVLIFLSGLQAGGVIGISDKVAVAIGLAILFSQIALAVYLFIRYGGKLGKYEFLEKEAFETEYGVDGMCRERLAQGESKNTGALTTGVLLCVLSAVPIVLTATLGAAPYIVTAMVCLLLIMVGIAVYLFISVCGVHASYKVLLQQGDYSPAAKKRNKKLDALTGIYWMAITFIFLAVSFYTGRWDRTWIIWAVSGVLFALVRVIAESVMKND